MFTENWGSSALEITVENGTGPYDFGLAEDASFSSDPWTGEDCMDGYELSSGDVLLYCHTGTKTGITIPYGDSLASLDEGATLFNREEDRFITFVAIDKAENCWVWGADPSYFDKLGCTEQ